MKYEISKKEISRRINAFRSLIVGILLGFSIIGVLLKAELIFISLGLVLIFIIGLFSSIILDKYFKRSLKTKIMLGEDCVERIGLENHQKIYYSEISKIVTKRKTDGTLRELRISDQKNTLIVDGLENFEDFGKELGSKVNIKQKIISEPLDFDSPFFYPILGLIIGGTSEWMFSFLSSFSYKALKSWRIGVSIYLIFLGIYFFIEKPIFMRRGNDSRLADNFFSSIFLLFGLIIIILASFNSN